MKIFRGNGITSVTCFGLMTQPRKFSAVSWGNASLMAAALAGCMVSAQTVAVPRQLGSVSSVDIGKMILKTDAGQEFTVLLPGTVRVVRVAPGSKDLSSATPADVSDIGAGDRVLVTGTAGDTGGELNATRVVLMKSEAVAGSHAAQEAAWRRGGGGIVRSVDAGAGTIVVAAGPRTLTVVTTPATIVRRYVGDSVRFGDAVKSTVAEIQPGDQLRVRGPRSTDGTSVTAYEIVTGTFRNFSGVLTAVDAGAGTVTLKDLATKKTVTVAVTASSDVRRIPEAMARAVAARSHGSATSGDVANGSTAVAPGSPSTHAGGTATPADGTDRAAVQRTGADLSQMLARLPAETLSALKPGDAVMIVASGAEGRETAVTLLAGVEPILSAEPNGQPATLSPWSMGGGETGEAGGASQP